MTDSKKQMSDDQRRAKQAGADAGHGGKSAGAKQQSQQSPASKQQGSADAKGKSPSKQSQ